MRRCQYVKGLLLLLLLASQAADAIRCRVTKHAHLAVGKDPSTSMTISFTSAGCDHDLWSSFVSPVGVVEIGERENNLGRYIVGQKPPNQYNTTFRGGRLYTSDHFHHILVDGLKPNTKYYYRCSALIPQKEVTREQKQEVDASEDSYRVLQGIDTVATGSFVTGPPPGKLPHGGLKFAMVSDLGQTMEATRTMKYLQANKEDIDAIILAGDLAYPNARPDRWDMWFDLLDRFSVFHEVSLQIATGNHDVDITDESGQIFIAYENRFQMPAIQPAIRKPSLGFHEKNLGVPYPLEYDYGNAYYAFTYGIARHVVVSSYSNFDPGSKQYTWLVDELESIDRSVTPWLLVTIHVPIYNTFCKHRKDVQVIRAREYLEPLFVEHHVNIVFSGHVHAYMRTKNVAFGELNDTAPMYIIAGDGGRQAKSPFFNAEPETWVASRDATIFGFGTIEIFNHTHVKWDWVHTGVASHLNTWRQNENVTFPHGEKDSVYLENQYLLASKGMSWYS